jgi:plastocyanin
MKKNFFLVSIFFLFFLTACAPGTEKVEYTIEMSEFAYAPDTLELKVGQEVTLHLSNQGALAHELMAGRGVIVEGGIPAGFEQDMFAGQEPAVTIGHDHADHGVGHDHGHGGFMVSVPGREEATLTFTVTETMVGEWEMGCFLDGGSHHLQGMKGKIVVIP